MVRKGKPMERVRIKDNAFISRDELAPVSNLTEKIVDKTLSRLEREGIFVFPETERDTKDLTFDQMILRRADGGYRSGNVMGMLGLGDERLLIASRFDGEDDFFFQYLVERVMDFPLFSEWKTDAERERQVFDFWPFLFPGLLKAALRKGLFKTYTAQNYNDGNVKGTIDVAAHVKKNTPFTGNIAYRRREFLCDNVLTELVRHTIEFLKRKPYGKKILRTAKEEVKSIVFATPGYQAKERAKVVEANRKQRVRHAYFREYSALWRLCLLILRQEKHQMGFGDKRMYGILFDGAWLWEEYLHGLLGDAFYHPRNKSGQGAQMLFSKNYGKIYPDFIGKDRGARTIADAKYKPIQNIGGRDYCQVLAYMFRFEAKIGYFLYPEAKGERDAELFLNRGTTYEQDVRPRGDVRVVKHGLRIPTDAANYDDFVRKMKGREEEFLRALEKR